MRALSPRPIQGSADAVAEADLELERLYRAYARTLVSRLRRRFGAETAEDIVQEAFLRVRRYSGAEPVRSPKALLTCIAINLGLDAVRAQPPSPPLALEALAERPEGALASDQDETVQLKQIILQLPNPLRDVFILHRIVGMPYAQIAAHCGISVKTVEWRMSKALAFCAARMRDYLLAACLLVALAFGFWAVSGGYVGARTYETAVGQQQTLRLADGSVVRLDTDSQVHVRLGSARREVDLFRGRAFFTVAHDASRPFLVTAGNAEVRAVGTRFSVQTEASDVRVVLVQGVVAVSSTHGAGRPEPVRLAAGQELTVDGGLGAPRAVDVALATSWLQNQLVFRGLPLKDAIAEVNRYTPRKLVLDAPGAGDTPVNGVFDTGDPMAFATAAADVCGLIVVAGHDGAVHLRAPDRAV